MRSVLIGALAAVVVSVSAAQIGPIRPGGGGPTLPTTARVPFLTTCPAGWTQDATLDGTMLLATTAAHGDVGGTGGANTLTPSGSVTAPTFSGNAGTTSATSGGTPAGTNASVSFTPTGTVAAPVFTGSSANTAAVSAGTPSMATVRPASRAAPICRSPGVASSFMASLSE